MKFLENLCRISKVITTQGSLDIQLTDNWTDIYEYKNNYVYINLGVYQPNNFGVPISFYIQKLEENLSVSQVVTISGTGGYNSILLRIYNGKIQIKCTSGSPYKIRFFEILGY